MELNIFKRKMDIMGHEGLFYPGCNVNEKDGTLTCKPKFDTGKNIFKGERPMKLKIDDINDIVILDDGETPEPLISKTLETIKKMGLN